VDNNLFKMFFPKHETGK